MFDEIEFILLYIWFLFLFNISFFEIVIRKISYNVLYKFVYIKRKLMWFVLDFDCWLIVGVMGLVLLGLMKWCDIFGSLVSVILVYWGK